MNVLNRVVDRLCDFALGISCLAIVFILVVGSGDQVGTQVFGWAIPSSIELQEAAEVLVIFGGLASVQRSRGHIIIDLLDALMSPRCLRWLNALSLAASCVLFGLVARFAWTLAAHSFAVREVSQGQLEFPIWPVKCMMFAGCVITFLECLRQFAVATVAKPQEGESRPATASGGASELESTAPTHRNIGEKSQ